MANKPTYKELVQKVKKLEQEAISREQAEEAFRKSEEKYRLLVKNLPSIVYQGHDDWSVEFFDSKIELLTGYSVDEFNLGRLKWKDIVLNEDIENSKEIFIRALKSNRSYIREYRIESKAGNIHWIQERGQIICDNTGKIVSNNMIWCKEYITSCCVYQVDRCACCTVYTITPCNR